MFSIFGFQGFLVLEKDLGSSVNDKWGDGIFWGVFVLPIRALSACTTILSGPQRCSMGSCSLTDPCMSKWWGHPHSHCVLTWELHSSFGGICSFKGGSKYRGGNVWFARFLLNWCHQGRLILIILLKDKTTLKTALTWNFCILNF